MKIIALALFTLALNSGVASAKDTMPLDVRKFLINADKCLHLSGEWDVDLPDENKTEIKQGIDKYCKISKIQLDKLSTKYSQNEKIIEELKKYDDSVKLYQLDKK